MFLPEGNSQRRNIYWLIAQSTERLAVNEDVAGLSPALPASPLWTSQFIFIVPNVTDMRWVLWQSIAVVASKVHNLEVSGSSPLSAPNERTDNND